MNLIDPVGNQTTFVYDALNRQTQEIDPLGKSATFAYDAGRPADLARPTASAAAATSPTTTPTG